MSLFSKVGISSDGELDGEPGRWSVKVEALFALSFDSFNKDRKSFKLLLLVLSCCLQKGQDNDFLYLLIRSVRTQ